MGKVQLAPLWSVAGGVVGLVVIALTGHLSPLGWFAGIAYLLATTVLLTRGLRRSGLERFGPANAVTLTRSTLVALVTALVATALWEPVPPALLVCLAAPALALDAVDGWVARRTGSTSELGARFDMEVDAFLLLVLSLAVAPELGWWVVTIGALRYAFAAAGLVWPWMNTILPPRYWRKVVTAVAGIALVVAVSGAFPRWVDYAATAVGLALLLESFGRDVLWLVREHRRATAVDRRWRGADLPGTAAPRGRVGERRLSAGPHASAEGP
ncbi:CDP-alcohol phosphatidyltransferase family protein [Microbacterium sp. 4R-513]|uniref:CDP-alcohol phosphatidyltransferase family protein n=1 Tax=Microbacterium sp. 4R-513 TaxID=2567934 RepID=UPI0013E17F10|nr:CDP-alcohol phosphatidyltransferase family protein [Microbacterium sp. 4R-513]QIG39573.1 CDP-alcohol phosphatidyltransferase family protein [Microbacterium sp. 4R-513]